MKALLAEGVDVNAVSERGQTALMLAAVSGRDEIVPLLLAAGADVGLKDGLGLTATEWSVRRGFSNIAQLIARASTANLPQQRNEALKPIHPAEHSGDRVEAKHAPEPIRRQSVAKTEISSDTARTESSEKPRTGLLAVLRARAAEANQAGTADSLRHQATVAQSDASRNGANQTEPLKEATPESKRETKRLLEPDPTLAESRRRAEKEIDAPNETQVPIFNPSVLANQRRTLAGSSVTTAATLANKTNEPTATPLPSFHQMPHNSSGRPLLWVMVALTLCGAAFVTYRLTNHASEPAPPAAAVVKKTEPPKVAPVKPLPVVGGALAGAELSVPDPEFTTASAGREGVSDIVTVRVLVNRKGQVISTRALNGDWSLRTAATKAARKATFAPEKLSAKGKVVTGTITYDFAAPATEPQAATSGSPSVSPAVTESHPTSGSPVANADSSGPVTGDALAGVEMDLPQAEYPESARSRGISGTIIVKVRVNRAGKVVSWATSSGDSRLRAAALKAAKKARFAPEKLPGKGEVVGTITYNFKL